MIPGSHIALRFEDNGRFHDDLVLEIDDRSWRCDSYYLMLDQAMLPDIEDATKVRRVLERLLDQWRTALEGLAEGASCFLPFDFSDQHTGWLRCAAAGPCVLIQPGSSSVAGYAIWPSDLGRLLKELPDFAPGEDVFSIERDQLLRSLRQAGP